MSVTIIGLKSLDNRLAALDVTHQQGFMEKLAVSAVEEEKRLVPRKTGNLGRSIHVGRVSPTSAETIASADYAAYVEFGTRAHEIRPSRKRVLRFKDAGGNVIYAQVVQHPGTRAQPFMLPGAERAVEKTGLADVIVKRWNEAG